MTHIREMDFGKRGRKPNKKAETEPTAAKKHRKSRRHKIAMANALSMAISAKRGQLNKHIPEGTYKGMHGVTLARLKFMEGHGYYGRYEEIAARADGEGGTGEGEERERRKPGAKQGVTRGRYGG